MCAHGHAWVCRAPINVAQQPEARVRGPPTYGCAPTCLLLPTRDNDHEDPGEVRSQHFQSSHVSDTWNADWRKAQDGISSAVGAKAHRLLGTQI